MPKSMSLPFLPLLFLLLALPLVLPSPLRAASGDLQVTCESGVKIYVDDKLKGETNDADRGLFVEGLSVGSHRVKAVKPGFQPVEKNVNILASQGTLISFDFKIMAEKIETLQSDEAQTVAKVGAFEFRSAPMGAKVYLDGVYKKVTDFRISNITIGRHKVRFELGGQVLEGSYNLGEGEILKLKAHFKKKEIINLNAVEAAEEAARRRAENEAEAQRQAAQAAQARAEAEAWYGEGRQYQAAANLRAALERYENAYRLWSGLPGLEAALAEVREELRREEERRQAAEREEKEKRISGDYVRVLGGCFQMGDVFGDGGRDEKPVHEVCVDTFAIGRYEVSQGLWRQMMGNNPSKFHKGDDYPVEQVSWDEVQEFIGRLNRQTGQRFRLPTEAEWEYACRSGGRNEKYCGGNDPASLAWYGESYDRGSTHPVGQKQPNGLGLYDMSGNVWEWVQDWYGYKYKEAGLFSAGIDINYYRESPRHNPSGPASGSDRVIRGGGWSYDAGLFPRRSHLGGEVFNQSGAPCGHKLCAANFFMSHAATI